MCCVFFFYFTATTETYTYCSTLSLHDALPICGLVDNVNCFTLDDKGKVERFDALLIDDRGKVEKLLKRKDKRPEKLDFRKDGKGRTLMPGIVDAHGHVMALGFRALTLDLSKANSLAEAQDRKSTRLNSSH